jgi:hydrogenase nickel incorporation protein HypA/HybF
MHEQSLVRQLLRQVQTIADEYPSCLVRSIRVRIGEFSGVEPELLANAYALLVADTSYAKVQLVVNRARLEAVCSRCESDFRIKRFTFQCPYCGSRELSIVGGEELLLESIAMEEPAL